jgi:hypothetical protein
MLTKTILALTLMLSASAMAITVNAVDDKDTGKTANTEQVLVVDTTATTSFSPVLCQEWPVPPKWRKFCPRI